jgi:hypothetical protein
LADCKAIQQVEYRAIFAGWETGWEDGWNTAGEKQEFCEWKNLPCGPIDLFPYHFR